MNSYTTFPQNCPCGKEHSLPVESITVAPNAAASLNVLAGGFACPVIICDENTKSAAYPHMAEFFDTTKTVTLPPSPCADNQTVDFITAALPKGADALIAVGSGTIHDLTRYVAGTLQIPFIAVPTAASVDGFVSNVAAMTWHGMKKSFIMQTPLHVVADTNIFANAPYRLTASGISDLLGKHTALADWKIAAAVTGEYFCQYVHDMVMAAVRDVEAVIDLFGAAPSVSKCANYIAAVEKLMHALLISGIAMQLAGNSRPASGAEHHLSHLWEMNVINGELDALHGEKVSIGLLLTLKRYKDLAAQIRGNFAVANSLPLEDELLQATFGKKGLYELIVEENSGILLAPQTIAGFVEKAAEVAEIVDTLPEYDCMKQILQKAGCLIEPTQIGLSTDLEAMSLALSPYVKNRVTLMRLGKVIG